MSDGAKANSAAEGKTLGSPPRGIDQAFAWAEQFGLFVLRLSPEGICRHCSPRLASALGRPTEEIVGCSLTSLITAETSTSGEATRESVQLFLESVQRDGAVRGHWLEFPDRNQRRHIWRLHAVLVSALETESASGSANSEILVIGEELAEPATETSPPVEEDLLEIESLRHVHHLARGMTHMLNNVFTILLCKSVLPATSEPQQVAPVRGDAELNRLLEEAAEQVRRLAVACRASDRHSPGESSGR